MNKSSFQESENAIIHHHRAQAIPSAVMDKKTMFIAVLGIVFGDIGTSPLYTFKTCFSHHVDVNVFNVLGIVSLIFWSLVMVVCVKYVTLILRADNHGEGGILALMSLVLRKHIPLKRGVILLMGLLGAALFYGDGVITPAISVLSALEGLTVDAPHLQPWIIPGTVLVLIPLFFSQSKGTAFLGTYFGIVMVTWFLVLGGLGLVQIIKTPSVLLALNPYYALLFFIHHGWIGFLALGAVVLAVTGVEALYADMGHFNRKMIQWVWYGVVFPALILNYFGQAAIVLAQPLAIENPFYFLVPKGYLYPMVILSTLATIIASQACISGVFSMTQQAMQLGFLPRMQVIYTSAKHIGQIYVPSINMLMFVFTLIAVLLFKTSDNLASAYGLAVTGIMVITTILTSILAMYQWEWSLTRLIVIFGSLLCIDLLFFSVNLLKIVEGGWFTLGISLCVMMVMRIWYKGSKRLNTEIQKKGIKLENFVAQIITLPPVRIPGSAVYMTSVQGNVSVPLAIQLSVFNVMHERVFILSIVTKHIPFVSPKVRIEMINHGNNIYQITAFYGFSEVPDIEALFQLLAKQQMAIDFPTLHFFIGRWIPVAHSMPFLSAWQAQVLIFLSKNAMNATDFYHIPSQQMVEIGVRYDI